MAESEELPELLLGELAHVLKPIVAGLLDAGVPYQALDEVVRQLFVEMAIQKSGPGTDTDSRVCVATGLARREVKRLREQVGARKKSMPESVSLGARIVAAWLSKTGYQDEQDSPLPLPRHAKDADQPSFDTLVRSVSQDVRSRAVLDEWLRLGVARLSEDDHVCLNSSAFVPTQGAREKAFYLGHNLHDHAAAAMENVLGSPGAPWLERCVHYTGLTADEIEQTRKLAERLGNRALAKVNQHIQTLPNPVAEPENLQRFSFGIYFYAAPDAPGTSNAKEKP